MLAHKMITQKSKYKKNTNHTGNRDKYKMIKQKSKYKKNTNNTQVSRDKYKTWRQRDAVRSTPSIVIYLRDRGSMGEIRGPVSGRY